MFEIKVNDRTLANALEQAEVAKGKVFKVQGTKYQIQPPGITFAEQLVDSNSETRTTDTDAVASDAAPGEK